MSDKKSPSPGYLGSIREALDELARKKGTPDVGEASAAASASATTYEMLAVDHVRSKLSQVGFVGRAFDKDYGKGPIGSDLMTQILDFRLHYFGEYILENQHEAFDLLWHDSSDPAARMLLGGVWDTNCDKVVNDLLDS